MRRANTRTHRHKHAGAQHTPTHAADVHVRPTYAYPPDPCTLHFWRSLSLLLRRIVCLHLENRTHRYIVLTSHYSITRSKRETLQPCSSARALSMKAASVRSTLLSTHTSRSCVTTNDTLPSLTARKTSCGGRTNHNPSPRIIFHLCFM